MKKNLIIWTFAIILVVIAFNVTSKNINSEYKKIPSPQAQSTEQDKIKAEDNSTFTNKSSMDSKIIDFTLTDLNDKKVSLSDYKGKNIYLNFFATWCPPCRAEMPDIEKMYQKYKDKGIVFLAVNLGEDKNTVKKFMEKNGYHFNVLLDSEETVSAKYNITGIPVSIFIDKNSNIVAKKVGAIDEKTIELYLNKLVTDQ